MLTLQANESLVREKLMNRLQIKVLKAYCKELWDRFDNTQDEESSYFYEDYSLESFISCRLFREVNLLDHEELSGYVEDVVETIHSDVWHITSVLVEQKIQGLKNDTK